VNQIVAQVNELIRRSERERAAVFSARKFLVEQLSEIDRKGELERWAKARKRRPKK